MKAALVRPPLPAEAGAIAALMSVGMSANVRRITILGCAGLHHWVAEQIVTASGDSFLVAEIEGRIVGMVSSRMVETTLVLNHLYTHADFRRHGIARALLRGALDSDAGTVAVDVFSESRVARAWYLALGMTVKYRRLWLETALPAPSPSGERAWTATGLPEADAAQARVGFSHFRLRTARAEYAIARLGDAVFRCAGFDILADPHALAGLAALDTRRALLSFGAPEQAADEVRQHGCIVEESERLSGPRSRVAERLSGL